MRGVQRVRGVREQIPEWTRRAACRDADDVSWLIRAEATTNEGSSPPACERATLGPVTADHRVVGWYFFFLGVALWLPATGRFFRRASERELRLMPWLNKLPWMSLYRNRIYQTVIRLLVATVFVVVGLLTVVGAIRFN